MMRRLVSWVRPSLSLGGAGVPLGLQHQHQQFQHLRFQTSDASAPTTTAAPPQPLKVKDGYVMNVFKGSNVKKTSKWFLTLERIGLGEKNGKMAVVDTARIELYARMLRTRRALLPQEWKGAMKVQIGAILECNDIVDPAQKIQDLLDKLYEGTAAPEQYDQSARLTLRGHKHHPGAISADSDRIFTAEGEEEELDIVDREITLNTEQQAAVDVALKGYNTYLGGQAGTGKTVVLRAIRRALKKQGLSLAMTATTGIAGCHIDGSTFHHALGIDLHGNFMKPERLLKYDVIIIDEISMMNSMMFNNFDRVMRQATGFSDRPFGGVQVITCGDFLQLDAIGAGGPLYRNSFFNNNFVFVKLTQQVRQAEHPLFSEQLNIIRKGVVPPSLYETVKMLPLEERVEDAVYLMPRNAGVDAMNKEELEKLPGESVRFGVLEQTPALSHEWTSTVILHTSEVFDPCAFAASFTELINRRVNVFPNEVSFYRIAKDGFVLRVKLPGKAEGTRRFAMASAFEETLEDIPGLLDVGSRVLKVMNASHDMDETLVTDDDFTLQKMIQSHPVIQPIDLKIGAKVLLRANLSSKFVNGSVGVVENFVTCAVEELPGFIKSTSGLQSDKLLAERVASYARYLEHQMCHPIATLPVVRFGEEDKDVIAIPPWEFSVGGDSSTNFFSLSSYCLPLSLAYAFTVHKVQGLTLRGKVHIKLEGMWDCNHLMYVAMSRVKHPNQLTIAGFKEEDVIADTWAVEFDEKLVAVADFSAKEANAPVAMWKINFGKRLSRLARGGRSKSGDLIQAAYHKLAEEKAMKAQSKMHSDMLKKPQAGQEADASSQQKGDDSTLAL